MVLKTQMKYQLLVKIEFNFSIELGPCTSDTFFGDTQQHGVNLVSNDASLSNSLRGCDPFRQYCQQW